MFVFNIKLKPSKKFVCIFSTASIIFALVCIICMICVHNKVPDTTVCREIGSYSLKAENFAEQSDFLKNFGYTPVSETVQSKKVTIPYKFNDTYEEYNELQNKIGLDLNRFKGRDAEMKIFELKNSETKYAVLLIYKDRVIGAHLTNGEYGEGNLPLI